MTFWRYGITIGRWGRWGFYIGVPLLGHARFERSPSARGFRWIGIFWGIHTSRSLA